MNSDMAISFVWLALKVAVQGWERFLTASQAVLRKSVYPTHVSEYGICHASRRKHSVAPCHDSPPRRPRGGCCALIFTCDALSSGPADLRTGLFVGRSAGPRGGLRLRNKHPIAIGGCRDFF